MESIDASELTDAELLFLAANEQCPFDPTVSALHGDRLPQTWGRWVAEPLLRELARRLERATKERDGLKADNEALGELRRTEAERATIAERERDAILRWSIRHAGQIGTTNADNRWMASGPNDRWWAIGDNGRVTGKTAEEVVCKAAGLDRETREESE